MKKYNSLNEAVDDLFHTRISSRQSISGGDINQSYALKLNNGYSIFMKQNMRNKLTMFEAEIKGIESIRNTNTIDVPNLLGYGIDGNTSFLLMDMIHEGKRVLDYWPCFAKELFDMHNTDVGNQYGYPSDTYIGTNIQINTWSASWIDFFREYRLKPQFEMAQWYFHESDIGRINRFMDKLDILLIEPEKPSLVHGDLWAGNYMTNEKGKAMLIDPACYYGHFEVDLAMTELFGGYPKAFYDAYKKIHPLQPGYESRKDVYNLYHLLNHLNLFGESYYDSVMRILDECI